jgi:hypothetical protein
MNISVEIEEAIISAIERYCTTEKETKEALKYFKDVLVTELIEESQGNFDDE